MTETDPDIYADERPERRVRGGRAPVIVNIGASGGVGTTTLALMQAQLAAENSRVPRVALVDAHLGRSDIRSWLAIGPKAPSVNTAFVEGDYRKALLDKDSVNKYRPASAHDISFGTVLASPDSFTTAEHILRSIEMARSVVDLVIVDSGSYGINPGGSFAQVALPLINSGAYALVASEMNRVATRAALDVLKVLAHEQVDRDRVGVVINRLDTAFADSKPTGSARTRQQVFIDQLLPLGNHIGSVDLDDTGVRSVMVKGQIPTLNLSMSSTVGVLLHRVTGRTVFEDLAAAGEVDAKLRNRVAANYDNQDSVAQPVKQPVRRGLGLRIPGRH